MKDTAEVEALIRIFGEEIVTPNPTPKAIPAYHFDLADVSPHVLLMLDDNIAILGEAGAGKTSLARKLTMDALSRGKRTVYFPCSRIDKKKLKLEKAIREFLRSLGSKHGEAAITKYFRMADVFVLDGCDEATTFGGKLQDEIDAIAFRRTITVKIKASKSARPEIPDDLRLHVSYSRSNCELSLKKAISALNVHRLVMLNKGTVFEGSLRKLYDLHLQNNPRVVVTTRDSGMLNVSDAFVTVRLMPFTDEQLEAFFQRWFAGTGKSLEPIQQFLRHNARIKEICRVPMIATIVAALYEGDYDLPESKVEVYEKRFDLLLDRWDRARNVTRRCTVRPRDKRLFLTRLALRLHLEHRRQFGIKEVKKIWAGRLASLYPGTSAEDLLSETRVCNNLIMAEGEDVYSLGHLSFQEYLAAEGLARKQWPEMLRSQYFDPWWRQVLVFYAGVSGDVSRILRLMQKDNALVDNGGLLEEMQQEARYTSAATAAALSDLRTEGLIRNERVGEDAAVDPSLENSMAGSPSGSEQC